MGNKFCKARDTDSVISAPSLDIREGTFSEHDDDNDNAMSDSDDLVYNRKRRHAVFHKNFDPENDSDDDESDTQSVHPKTDFQREKLQCAMTSWSWSRSPFLFTTLDDIQLKQVIDAMFKHEVEAGEFLFQEDDDGGCFFVINEGKYHALKIDHYSGDSIVVYEWKDTFMGFGESALLYRMLRPASVQAVTDGSVWAIERETFKKIVIKSEYQKRKLYETFLENVRLLENLEKNEREKLADAMQSKVYSADEAVLREGDRADGMYFVEAGTVAVLKQMEGVEKKVSEVGLGGYFGELGLITEKPRQATVIAMDEVKLAFLDRLSFERLVGPCMEIIKRNFNWELTP